MGYTERAAMVGVQQNPALTPIHGPCLGPPPDLLKDAWEGAPTLHRLRGNLPVCGVVET